MTHKSYISSQRNEMDGGNVRINDVPDCGYLVEISSPV